MLRNFSGFSIVMLVLAVAASRVHADTTYTVSGNLSYTTSSDSTPTLTTFNFMATGPSPLVSGSTLSVASPGIDLGPIILPAGTILDFSTVAGNANGTSELYLPSPNTVTLSPSEYDFEYFQLYFTPSGNNYVSGASGGQEQSIFYTSGNLSGYAIGTVTGASLTPEPTTLALSGLASLGLLRRRRIVAN